MKKSGFTLVELLAVIAILAILVIIALPNVLGMFNQAKKDTFTTETKEMVKIAQQQYLMTFGKQTRYATAGSKDVPNADINIIPCTASTTLSSGQYCKIEKETGNLTSFVVEFNPSDGQVDKIKATDGTYKYELSGGNYDATKVTATEVSAANTTEKPIGPVSFNSDSWSVIVKAVKNGNISKYSVGDTKEVDLGAYGKHTLRIANKSTPDECKNSSFSQTACGFVIEFEDRITDYYMNETDTNKGGWEASKMRTFVNNEIYNSLPQEIRDSIITTKVVSSHGSEDTNNFVTNDKLYLLAGKEVYAVYQLTEKNDSAINTTRLLDGYKTAYNPYKGGFWWLRTSDTETSYIFQASGPEGEFYPIMAKTVGGVSPAFRIG